MPRQGKRISPHAERIAAAVNGKWRTANEVAELAQVAPRTARLHLAILKQKGQVEERATWPALSYRRH